MGTKSHVEKIDQRVIVNPLAPLCDALILEICEHIDFPDGDRGFGWAHNMMRKNTFAALARTCKYLHPFGMRYLYHHYQTTCHERDNRFLVSLSNHPELASRVREVVLSRKDRKEGWSDDPSTSKAVMRKRVRTHSLPYGKRLLADFSKHPVEVVLALLIYDARHSIRRLERDYNSVCEYTCWFLPLLYSAQKYLNASHCTADGFARLQHLDLGMFEGSFSEMSAVMALPSLKYLGLISTEYEEDKDYATWGIALRSSKVQFFNMRHATSSTFMPRLLQSCETVTEIRCELIAYELDPIEWFFTVIEAANTHRSTLKQFLLGPDLFPEGE